ncbi:MAG: hypothetical protein Edafosvirus39_2 [Edafosvirus sp.]|uniref:Uncharacterized protein n=1 Tax=Edafosvirus sp. TaxID=2487765 RepID=A0A3G4ZZS1_9VIRU|nr:MAG: hypothetical protein Edafosvirus39_2 [Edafosvirus sp.]
MVLIYNVLNVTSTATATTSVDTIFINAVDPTVNVNLPAVTSDGQTYLIKRIDQTGNSVYILPNGSDTIGGSSTQAISNGQIIQLVSTINNSNWEYTSNISL